MYDNLTEKRELSDLDNWEQPQAWCHLIKLELNRVCKRANLTDQQDTCFRWWVCYGVHPKVIAERMGISDSQVYRHIRRAREKVEQVKYVGLLTVVWEEFGPEGLRELLEDGGRRT